MLAHGVGRDADNDGIGPLEFVLQGGEVDCFGRAAAGVVLRVEIEHDLASAEVREADRAFGIRLQLEIGCDVSFCGGITHGMILLDDCSGSFRSAS